jgi:hypothetical protein
VAENKKVKNAQSISYDGINFKSRLECNCYKLLKEAGFEPLYEPVKYKLLPSSQLEVGIVYTPRKKDLTKSSSYRDLTYTPDFEFLFGDRHIYYDAKGKPNDAYPLKKKLFLHYLEDVGEPYIFFEPHNIAQIRQSINILRHELYQQNN